MGNTNFHVTALRGTGLHGHDTSHCDPGGCAGDELYLGDVAALRREAALAGDREQVTLCDLALESLAGEHDDDVRAARAECARVIADAAMRASAEESPCECCGGTIARNFDAHRQSAHDGPRCPQCGLIESEVKP